nr:hypothetical protein [Tanacetum cinerariifolium]
VIKDEGWFGVHEDGLAWIKFELKLLLKDVLMMELVMHTKKNDTVFHAKKTGMLMLVVEINVGGMTANVVDKLTCSSDDVQPRQVDLRSWKWFAPYWIGDNIPNNQNGWIEEDVEEKEEDPEVDLEKDPEEEPKDDDDMEMDNEAKVIDPYMDDGSNNLPPPNSEDEETPLTSPVIPDADGQPIPPIASFGQNFHFGESSSTANLLTGNSKIVMTGPMCLNLGTTWKRTVRNVISDLSGLKKLVKGLSDRFDEYERSKVFEAKRVLEKELSEGSFPLPPASQVREPPAEPSARPVPAPYPDDPYVVTRDAAIAAAAIATFGIDDDDDDTAPIDSQKVLKPESGLRERVQNEANRAEGPNIAPVARECTFADFMKCSPITFCGNKGAVATLGIEAVTRKTWAEMKGMMTEEFCPPEEIQRMELILCPGMVPTEQKKVEAYIRGLSKNIKGEVTSSKPATLNKAVWMAHTLMEQKVKAIAEK